MTRSATAAKFLEISLLICSILLITSAFGCADRGVSLNDLDNGKLGKGKMIDSDGQVRSLADFDGDIIVLNFWASWCVECIAEFPTLVNLQRQFDPKTLQIISILEDDDIENLKQLSLSASDLGFPILIDSDGVLKRRFDIRGLPTTIILGCNRTPLKFTDPLHGVEAEQVIGGREWDTPPVVEKLKRIAESAGCS